MKTDRKWIRIDILPESLPFPVDMTRLREMLTTTLRRCGCRRARVCVRLMSSREISGINQHYLNHKGPTDVVSFDLSEDKGPRVFDLAVNAQLAAAEARRRGHSGEAELALYVLHGLLHCVGYDDIRAEDAKKMHGFEDAILRENGYGEVYSCK